MPVQRFLHIFLVIFLLITAQACTGAEDKEEKPVFKQIPQIEEIKPKKPVKIKLKRNAKDNYSWDISGNDVDEIIRVNKRLRESLKTTKIKGK